MLKWKIYTYIFHMNFHFWIPSIIASLKGFRLHFFLTFADWFLIPSLFLKKKATQNLFCKWINLSVFLFFPLDKALSFWKDPLNANKMHRFYQNYCVKRLCLSQWQKSIKEEQKDLTEIRTLPHSVHKNIVQWRLTKKSKECMHFTKVKDLLDRTTTISNTYFVSITLP